MAHQPEPESQEAVQTRTSTDSGMCLSNSSYRLSNCIAMTVCHRSLSAPNVTSNDENPEIYTSSPTTDLLISLIRYNVLRASIANIKAIGLTMEVMGSPIPSPFTQVESLQWLPKLPPSLHPTELQLGIPHHPYVDIIALRPLRDTIIRFGSAVNGHEFCADLMGNGLDGKHGVIVWGEAWDPSAWEVTETFARKWSWLLAHVPETIEFTNRWRAKRDEPMLVL
jgi:hypothetical protein